MRGRGWERVLVALGSAVLLIALAALWVRGDARTAVPTPPSRWATPAELEVFVQRQRSELDLSGLVVVVLRDGVPYYSGSVGSAGTGRRVTAATPFVLGSTSKQFTGLVVQRLVEDGRLSLAPAWRTSCRRSRRSTKTGLP